MLSTQALRDQLDRYIAGNMSVEALEEWLAAESWDMNRWLPIGMQRFVQALQSLLIQFSDGQLSNEELHKHLLSRRDQLQRASDVTTRLDAERARLDEAIKRARQKPESISGSQAVMLSEAALA